MNVVTTPALTRPSSYEAELKSLGERLGLTEKPGSSTWTSYVIECLHGNALANDDAKKVQLVTGLIAPAAAVLDTFRPEIHQFSEKFDPKAADLHHSFWWLNDNDFLRYAYPEKETTVWLPESNTLVRREERHIYRWGPLMGVHKDLGPERDVRDDIWRFTVTNQAAVDAGTEYPTYELSAWDQKDKTQNRSEFLNFDTYRS
jgi:hypothetical protein